MLKKIYQTKIFHILAILFFLLFFHFLGILSPIENSLSILLSHPLSWANSFTQHIIDFFDNFKENRELKEKSNYLKQRILELETKVIELEQVLSNKEILKEQQEFLQEKNLKSIPAKIIARNVQDNSNLLVINKGLKDGLQKGLAVIADKGVIIGRIVQVSDKISFVLLLNDSRSQISAASSDGFLLGIVSGYESGVLKLEYILKDRNLDIGDLVATSNIEPEIPQGLLIGEISDLKTDERQIFKTAFLFQLIDLKNISIVSVVLP